jgi:hypothetical protein
VSADRDCICGHPESAHDLVQCKGRDWHDLNKFRCPCPGFTGPDEARPEGCLERCIPGDESVW